MRTLISCLLITLLSFGLMMNEASAKRFGSGRSFGVQRSHSSLYSPNKAQPNNAYGQRNPNLNNTSRWGGLLGGLLIGGLLTSLFMGHGVASGIMSWLLIGGLIFLIVSWFRRKAQFSVQRESSGFSQQSPFNNNSLFNDTNPSGSSAPASVYPANFSPAAFLREAKVKFNRLQAAFDEKNVQDLRAFTAPEVFAEIKMQLDEIGDTPNKTEVISLDAELLDVSQQFNSAIASVRFTGSVKENNGPATPFNEIWHFRQFDNNKEWVVGGIQQEDLQP